MALKDRVSELLDHINNNADYIEHNRVLLDMFNGNLSQYILEDLERALSYSYFQQMKDRIVPINILKRLIDKLSKVYIGTPNRVVLTDGEKSKNKSDIELKDFYVKAFQMDKKGNYADEYANMFKGYAWEPFLHEVNGENVPKLKTLPYDKFLPFSDDGVDPSAETVFIKFIGEKSVLVEDKRHASKVRTESRQIYFAFSKDDFWAFDENGHPYAPAAENENVGNEYGVIPFHYGNRGRDQLIPTQDSDIIRMTKVIPLILSDASGTILFQCFSIIWGVDLDMDNLKMSPNAIWNLKSDASQPDNKPQIGTIKPEADIDKISKFVFDIFVLWVETKGVTVGAVGNINGANLASGIAKILDEMDVSELRRVQMEEFEQDEAAFWQKMKVIHNYWVSNGLLKNQAPFSEGFGVRTEFDEPKPKVDRREQFIDVNNEVEAGYLPVEDAIRQHYPDLEEEDVQKRVEHYNKWNSVNLEEVEGEEV